MKGSSAFRKLFAEKLMDLGNLSIGALVLGQFVTDRAFSNTLFVSGFVTMLILYTLSYIIGRGGR